MKKLILLSSLLLSLGAAAQTQYKGALNTNDTLANSGTLNLAKLGITGVKSCVTFQVDMVKISGTVAGRIDWQRRIGGNNYVTVSSSTLTDGSTQYGYSHTPSTADDYRAQVVVTGGTASFKGYILYR